MTLYIWCALIDRIPFHATTTFNSLRSDCSKHSRWISVVSYCTLCSRIDTQKFTYERHDFTFLRHWIRSTHIWLPCHISVDLKEGIRVDAFLTHLSEIYRLIYTFLHLTKDDIDEIKRRSKNSSFEANQSMQVTNRGAHYWRLNQLECFDTSHCKTLLSWKYLFSR